MAYSSEVVRKARQRLAQEKADRESQILQRQREAYAKVPRIQAIDMQLRSSMSQAAQAAFAQGIDAREAITQVMAENLKLQKERQALADANFPAGYLDETPICPHCGGTGYIGTSMCSCLLELCRQEQKKEISVLAAEDHRFENFRLDYYSDRPDPKFGSSPRVIMEKTRDACLRYAQTFGPDSGNLLFVGNTGLGKTFLSASVAAMVAERGFSVAYETAARLFSKLEKDRFSPSEQIREEVQRLESCDLLIIDDLGTELPGQFVTAALYNLVNERLLAGKSMVISTNLNVDEIAQRYNPQIASRLQGSFNRLTFVGQDIRVMKNRGF